MRENLLPQSARVEFRNSGPKDEVRHSVRERRPAWNNDVVKLVMRETETAERCCLDRLVNRLVRLHNLMLSESSGKLTRLTGSAGSVRRVTFDNPNSNVLSLLQAVKSDQSDPIPVGLVKREAV
jgi:hypothetical protein